MKYRQSIPRFIIFFGPVGVGKTTLAEFLRSRLSKKGLRVKITFLKAFHGLSFIVWDLVARILHYKVKTHNHNYRAPWLYVSQISEKLAWELTLITVAIDTFLSIPLKLLHIELLKFLYDTVICEEYLLGTISDYLFTLLKAKNKRGSSILRFSLRVFFSMLSRYAQKSVIVFLDANFHVLINRWNMRGRGEPQHIYVLYQKMLIMKFIEYIKVSDMSIRSAYVDTSNLHVGNLAIMLDYIISSSEKLGYQS